MSHDPEPHNRPAIDAKDTATTGQGTGPVDPTAQVEAYMDSEVSQLGDLIIDPGLIPATATERFHTFDTPQEIEDYLNRGGLVFFDTDGTPIPNPIVHILKESQPDDPDYFHYVVYIDDETQ